LPSRELNRGIRELIRLIGEPRDLAVISIHVNRVSEQLVHDEQGYPEEDEFHPSGGDPLARRDLPERARGSALGFIAQVRLEITITPGNRA